jgi:hypothetical protein
MSDIERIDETCPEHIEAEDTPTVDEALHVEVTEELSETEPTEEA